MRMLHLFSAFCFHIFCTSVFLPVYSSCPVSIIAWNKGFVGALCYDSPPRLCWRYSSDVFYCTRVSVWKVQVTQDVHVEVLLTCSLCLYPLSLMESLWSFSSSVSESDDTIYCTFVTAVSSELFLGGLDLPELLEMVMLLIACIPVHRT